MGKKSRRNRSGDKQPSQSHDDHHPHQQHIHHKAGEGTHHHHKLHDGPLYNKYHKHHSSMSSSSSSSSDNNSAVDATTQEEEQQQNNDPLLMTNTTTTNNANSTIASTVNNKANLSAEISGRMDKNDKNETATEPLAISVATEDVVEPQDQRNALEDSSEKEATGSDLESPHTQATDEMTLLTTPINNNSDTDDAAAAAAAALLDQDEHVYDDMTEENSGIISGSQTRYVRLPYHDNDDDEELDGDNDNNNNRTTNRSSCWPRHGREDLRWILALAAGFEIATCIMRFGFHMQSTRDTSRLAKYTLGLRIHHGYIGIVMIMLVRWGCRSNSNNNNNTNGLARTWLVRVGWALILSDLCHHFLVLWPITGSPHFDLVYPSSSE